MTFVSLRRKCKYQYAIEQTTEIDVIVIVAYKFSQTNLSKYGFITIILTINVMFFFKLGNIIFIFIHQWMVERMQSSIQSDAITLTTLKYSATVIVHI